MEVKPLQPKSLDVFCDIFDFVRGQADITCPATDYRVSCLAALERRGLIQWDTERIKGKNKRWAALTELGARYGCEGLALAQVPEAQAPKRNRVWLKVQFDLNNEDYQKAYNIAGELAHARKLAPTIRDLLLHGIPDTTETRQFETMMGAFAEMRQEMKTIADENRMLREQLIQLQNTPVSTYTPPVSVLQPVSGGTQGNGGLKPLGGLKAVAAPNPVFDDEDDEDLIEIKRDESAGMKATQNFIKSLMDLSESTSTGESTLTPRQIAQLAKDTQNE